MDVNAEKRDDDCDGSGSRESVEADVARRNDRSKLTTRSLELGQYVEDIYASGARLWTKDMFHSLEADLAKEPRPETVLLRSMNGIEVSVELPSDDFIPDENEEDDEGFVTGPLHIMPDFNTYQNLVEAAETKYQSSSGYESEQETEEDRPVTEHDKIEATRALCLSQGTHSHPRPFTYEYSSLKALWDETWANWSKSAACKELISTIAGISHVPKTVNKIVCFGLGPPSVLSNEEDGEDEEKSEQDGMPVRRYMTQHAAAFTMATEFGNRIGTGPLKIFAQDPVYSDTDKQLLRKLGVEVVEGFGSLGFTHVDNDTVVYSIAPNVPVRQIVADIAKPAAMVWCTAKPAEKGTPKWRAECFGGTWHCVSPWSTDPESPRTAELIESYKVYAFPKDSDRFGNVSIYVRSD